MRIRVGLLCALAAPLVAGLTAPEALAQRPAGADTLSPQAVAESLKVLATIRRQLDRDKNNAELWYHRGMLAWALHDRDRASGGLRELDWTRLAREADSSIRIAASIAPKNARYQLTKGQYFLGTGWIPVRVQSYWAFNNALEAARESGDSRLIAESLVEKGRVHWRRYDPSSFGGIPAEIQDEIRIEARRVAGDSALADSLQVRDIGELDATQVVTRESLRAGRAIVSQQFRRTDGGFDNEIDYVQAEQYFREAYDADPTYLRGYQQLAMLFADRHRWPELAALARGRIRQEPGDAWAWMTLGLAAHRMRDTRQSAAAFDSGFARLDPLERGRLDNIARVLRPSDAEAIKAWTPGRRALEEKFYWQWSAPLWSREEDQARPEFLARVTFAELRWTVAELGRRGIDSDRGTVHVRYGPADGRAAGRMGETWWYDYARLVFVFNGMPTFGTAYFADADLALDRMDSIPARWDNVTVGRVDSLPVRIARFRASDDSVDVVFSTHPPIAGIRAAAAVDVPARADFWLFDTRSTAPLHITEHTRQAGARAVTRRVPVGSYVYRFEASAEGSLHAARAMSDFVAGADRVSGFHTTGFGISDVLLAGRAEPRGAPRRWTDYEFTPSAGTIRVGEPVAMIWETYDLADRDGSSEYEVTLTLVRKYEQFLNRVRARVISALAAMVGNEQTEDRVIFRYDRSVPHAPVVTDNMTLVLDDVPPGNYDLLLDVRDKVTGQTTSRLLRVVVRE